MATIEYVLVGYNAKVNRDGSRVSQVVERRLVTQLGHFSANEFLRNRRRNFLLYTCNTPKENEMGMALKLQFKEATGWVMIYEYNDL